MRTRNGWLRLAALLAVLLLIAGACGRDDDDEDVGAGGTDDTAQEGPKELTSAPGFDMEGGVIKVGVLTPLSGPVAGVIGIPLTEGNRVFAERVNAAGGVAGKYRLELVEQDNQYNRDLTKTKYRQIKDDVVLFAQILGTPPTQAVLVDLRRDNIMASPASLDAEWIGEEVLIPVAEPYQIQTINGAAWLVEEEDAGEEPICFFGADDPYGEAGLEGLQFAAEQMDFEIAVTARYDSAEGASTDYTAQITQLRDGDCNAVFVTALPTQTNAFLTKAQQLGFTPQYFFGQSPTYITAFSQSPVWQQNYYLTGTNGPDWGDESVPGMKQMLEDIQKYRPDQKPDIYFTFGYAQMMTIVEILEKAIELGDLSREGLIRAQAEVGEVDVMGLYGNWTYGPPDERVVPRSGGVFKIDPEAPGGLRKVAGLTSDAAEEFEFER